MWLFTSDNMEPRRLLQAGITLLLLVASGRGGEQHILSDSLVVDCRPPCVCVCLWVGAASCLCRPCSETGPGFVNISKPADRGGTSLLHVRLLLQGKESVLSVKVPLLVGTLKRCIIARICIKYVTYNFYSWVWVRRPDSVFSITQQMRISQ